MRTTKHRMLAAATLMLVLATAGIGITQAAGRGSPTAATGSIGSVGEARGTTVADAPAETGATLDSGMDADLDATMAALGLGVLGDSGELGLDTAPPAVSDRLAKRLGRLRHRPLARVERLVHAEATIDLPEKGITTVGADHGTVAAIGDGTIAVKRADGQTVTIATNADTKVRAGRKAAALSDIKSGNDVLVASRKVGATWTAMRIFVIPAGAGEAAPAA